MRVYGGKKHQVQIRRLKCTQCGKLHNELPSQLTPHKHYATGVIEDVISGRVDEDEDRTVEGPGCLTLRLL